MSRVVGGLVSLIVLFTAVPSRALFHLAVIDEVMARLGSDTTTQYVEIRMLSANQNLVAHSRLTAFNCNGSSHTVLLEVPSNVTNQGAGVRWIMAHKSPIGGITPDFTWTTGTIPTDCGMVCWGAPGIIPPNPPSWDAPSKSGCSFSPTSRNVTLSGSNAAGQNFTQSGGCC